MALQAPDSPFSLMNFRRARGDGGGRVKDREQDVAEGMHVDASRMEL